MKNISGFFLSPIVRNLYTYSDYMLLLEQLVREGKATGLNQSESYVHYTKLNLHRTQRLNKTVVLNEDLKTAIMDISTPQTWYVITEAWCGDAAQILPVFSYAAALNPVITLQLMLRDENLDLMDQYQTRGGRSIPKLIVVDQDFNELFNWGPRPAAAQEMLYAYKANPVKTYGEFSEDMQRWYIADKTQTLQKELLLLIQAVSAAK
jgi:hypothetical protein